VLGRGEFEREEGTTRGDMPYVTVESKANMCESATNITV